MSHTNTWETEGLYRKFTGYVSGEEILKSNFELHAHPDFNKLKYIINDFTEMSDHSIEIAHAKVYATTDDVVSVTKGALKIALLITQADLLILANNYRVHLKNETFECEIFKTIEEARAWINSE